MRPVRSSGVDPLRGCPRSREWGIARIESGRVDPGGESLHPILASVGLEPRIHLEKLDDHDLVLAAIDAKLTKEEQVFEEKRHQRSVGKFKTAHPVGPTS